MPKQLCFPGLKPPIPTLRTPSVARRIAERIVEEVNLDEYYWTAAELPDRIADVAEEIVAHGNPATVFSRLNYQREAAIYAWEGIDDHCQAIADDIVGEEVYLAVEEHRRHYGA